MSDILSRPYMAADRAACLAIFDGNVPAYFAPEERAAFADHLDGLPAVGAPYLVLEDRGAVVGCSGLSFAAQGTHASLSWGMVDRTRHGGGLGTRLLLARLAMARATPGLTELVLETSQHTRRFYERFGFAVLAVTPDGFGPGLDRCDMILRL